MILHCTSIDICLHTVDGRSIGTPSGILSGTIYLILNRRHIIRSSPSIVPLLSESDPLIPDDPFLLMAVMTSVHNVQVIHTIVN